MSDWLMRSALGEQACETSAGSCDPALGRSLMAESLLLSGRLARADFKPGASRSWHLRPLAYCPSDIVSIARDRVQIRLRQPPN